MYASQGKTSAKKVLGLVGGFDELASPDRRLGRKVANFSLTAALLQYSDFDELHFFLPFFGALKPFEQVYGGWLNTSGAGERVKILPAAELPAALERNEYLALHATEHHRFFPRAVPSAQPMGQKALSHNLHPPFLKSLGGAS